MKHGVLFILLSLLCVPFGAYAQVSWLEKSCDLGLFKEKDGIKKGVLRFVNSGSEPVVITDSRVSCGCVSVEYTDEPIAPGDTARINVSYNPLGRPGKFNKTIRIYTGDNQTYTLRVTGSVLGAPESLVQFYPVEVGPLRISHGQLKVGNVPKGKTMNYFINGYNQTMDTIPVALHSSNPAITVASNYKELPPGETVTWSLALDTRKVDTLGPLEIILKVEGGEKKIEIPFVANVVLDMSPSAK